MSATVWGRGNWLIASLIASMLVSDGAVAARISGAVVDPDRNPIPYTSVVFLGTRFGAMADTAGHWTLSVPAGTYVLRFQCLGFVTKEESILVEERRTTMIETTLHVDPQRTGAIVDRIGEVYAYPVVAFDLERSFAVRNNASPFVSDVPEWREQMWAGFRAGWSSVSDDFSDHIASVQLGNSRRRNYGADTVLIAVYVQDEGGSIVVDGRNGAVSHTHTTYRARCFVHGPGKETRNAVRSKRTDEQPISDVIFELGRRCGKLAAGDIRRFRGLFDDPKRGPRRRGHTW